MKGVDAFLTRLLRHDGHHPTYSEAREHRGGQACSVTCTCTWSMAVWVIPARSGDAARSAAARGFADHMVDEGKGRRVR